jgi:hypothetical protein
VSSATPNGKVSGVSSRNAKHWHERVNGLRRALRSQALTGAGREECRTVLREALQGLRQAYSTLTALKTRLLRGCTVSVLTMQ